MVWIKIKMKKNKGFIGLGVIVAIILGIIVVGGGAYYLGSKNNSNQGVNNQANYLPTDQNQNNYQPINTTNNQNQPIINSQPVNTNTTVTTTTTKVTSKTPQQACVDTANSLLPAYILEQGDYLDLKINTVNFFALKSNTSDSQYFTGNPTNDACMVNVNYSVKLKPGAINAGNGTVSLNGWTINKSGYATIDKNSSGYYVYSMGTGY